MGIAAGGILKYTCIESIHSGGFKSFAMNEKAF
jgi:hypothetical protein